MIGDRDSNGGRKTVQEIKEGGGYVLHSWRTYNGCSNQANALVNREAIFTSCDVTSWDDQVAMFEAALTAYSSVDIVVRTLFFFAIECFLFPLPSLC